MKKNKSLFLIVSVVVSFCLICSVAILVINMGEPATRAEQYAKKYDGSVEAYNQIFNSNDCAFLQQQFDNAYEISNSAPGTIHSQRAIGYMQASNERMKEIGCY